MNTPKVTEVHRGPGEERAIQFLVEEQRRYLDGIDTASDTYLACRSQRISGSADPSGGLRHLDSWRGNIPLFSRGLGLSRRYNKVQKGKARRGMVRGRGLGMFMEWELQELASFRLFQKKKIKLKNEEKLNSKNKLSPPCLSLLEFSHMLHHSSFGDESRSRQSGKEEWVEVVSHKAKGRQMRAKGKARRAQWARRKCVKTIETELKLLRPKKSVRKDKWNTLTELKALNMVNG